VSDITTADMAAAGFGSDFDYDAPQDAERALTGMRRYLTGYYNQSLPPWLTPANPAHGATAGAPGAWTPAGSTPPDTVAHLIAGQPYTITPSPATAWTTGQYVQTGTAGPGGQAHWTGTAWAAAPALAAARSRRRTKNGDNNVSEQTEPAEAPTEEPAEAPAEEPEEPTEG